MHAYTRPRATGEGSRVKDLVDILLIAELRQMDGRLLQQALQAFLNPVLRGEEAGNWDPVTWSWTPA